MRRFLITTCTLALVLAACGGTAATTVPTVAAPTVAAPTVAAPTVAAPTAAAPTAAAPTAAAPTAAAPTTVPTAAAPTAAAPTAAAPTTAASVAATSPAGGVLPWAAEQTGAATLSGWQSTGAEGTAVQATIDSAKTALPGLALTYKPIAGDYVAAMTANFAAHDVPDLFYVDASYALSWADQTYLTPLDDYISKSGFDTSAFFPAAASVFKGSDGKVYGLPKDFNTIAMAVNTDIVTAPPTTMDALMTWATAAKGKGTYKAPMCLNASLDRELAFIYANGGSLLTADGTASAIDTAASKTAVQWYLDLFKNGLAMTASDMGDDWCGTALGKGDAAIIFEGGWLDPSMSSTYPTVKYAWNEMPVGTSGSPVTISFTVSYAIGADSKNKDQGFALLTYLTGATGMNVWTSAGIALPSRSDVPIPQGKDILAKESAYAKPGSGFMPGYDAVQKAFADAMTNQIQTKTFDAGPVVTATKTAIDAAFAAK